MNAHDAVLVTGAAGHVGSEIVARLGKRGHRVFALVHDRPEIVANNGRTVLPTRVLKGDVRQPYFGLEPSQVSELADQIRLIIHCAAVTDFGLPEQRYTELNVDGTARAIDLARCWNAGLIHLSTAYICGEIEGTFSEDQFDIGQQFGNDYERSKFRAEELVREAEIDWAVVRPGIVSGEYRTGHSRVHKNVYQVVKLIVEGKLRTLPGNYSAALAFSPIGHVADTVTALVDKFTDNIGCTFHAVGANALSLQALSDVLAEYPSLRMADLVPPSSFHPDDLDDIERAYFLKVGVLYTTYLQRRPHFDSTNTRDRLGVEAPPIGAGYIRRVLDSCVCTGYFAGPEPSVADVLASLQMMRDH